MGYANDFAKLWFTFSREYKAYMDHNLGPGLTEGQLVVIEYLLKHEQVKPSDLIDYLVTTPAAVTTILDRMEKAGLVARERDESDRRIVRVKLTESGIEEGKRGLELREAFLQNQLDQLSTHNQQVLIYLFGKVAAFSDND